MNDPRIVLVDRHVLGFGRTLALRHRARTVWRGLARYGIAAPEAGDLPLLREAQAQLTGYFEGRRAAFDLPLDLRGADFQRAVWEALLTIPYGETCSYGDVAAAIGRPRAARPVGQAVGANPVGVIVPCHRVIGSDGRLTGYGGGLDLKRALLRLEGVLD
ncbi:MAG: methylated-DNA--[protein]-cysteine S-methyltransferase [Chloroflexi bacterium]|nr:methylated-DNA--[protein]-cysteine S-methyltransferase [Chloroflexota bacterium]